MATRSPQEIIDEIIEKTKEQEYIFRGESMEFDLPLASNLYRHFCLYSKDGTPPIKSEHFSILKVERDIIAKAKKQHFPASATKMDVWTQLQHYGGKTGLIDFTYNLHIALFFTCYGNPDKNGKLFMFPRDKFYKADDIENKENRPEIPKQFIPQDLLMTPTGKDLRVVVQNSVFVHAYKGYIEDTGQPVTISPKEKEDILTYLQKNFKVDQDAIYNDIHGFIKNIDNHSTEDIEFYRGLAWYNKKNYTNTIKCYDKVIEINPQLAAAHNNRGLAKYALGDNENAILDYNKSIDINPQEATTYNNRGLAKSALGYNENAILDYDKAIELDPQSAQAYNNRGYAKYNLNRYGDAILDYDKAIEINPQLARAYYNRGSAKSALGDKDGAERDWLKAKELDGK